MNASANNLPLKRQTTSSGFTLIELMVTIAVLALIVSIAAPNISTQLANQRVKSTAATFANALKEAKVESIIRRQNVEVVYDGASTITLSANDEEIASYNINKQSTINVTPATATTVVFQPNKVIAGDNEVLYTICDSSSSNEIPSQVRVNKIASVSTIAAGSCP